MGVFGVTGSGGSGGVHEAGEPSVFLCVGGFVTALVLDNNTAERLKVVVRTTSDPTGIAPDFSVAGSDADDPGSWVAGQWSGAWDDETGVVTAETPVMGDGEALDVTVGEYSLWVRWTVPGEVPVKRIGLVRIT
jgi:hypothetical protein